jgi:hypothetical protein
MLNSLEFLEVIRAAEEGYREYYRDGVACFRIYEKIQVAVAQHRDTPLDASRRLEIN